MIVNATVLSQSFDRQALRDKLESTVFDEISGAYVFSTIAHGGVQPDTLAVFGLNPSGWIQVT